MIADRIDQIIAYEMGELPDEGIIELFQHLIDTGMVWQLQGHYVRTAEALLKDGKCHPRTILVTEYNF